MAQTWNYDVDLPGGMTHTVQVQSNSKDADFNVRVLDSAGNVVAEDTGPEAGAECSLTTRESGKYVVQIELVEGHSGFSLNVSSKTASSTERTANDEDPASSVDTCSALTQQEIEGLLAAHNQWRAKYGCPTLEWCDDLANFAQDWANELQSSMQMKHRSPNDFGENLYWCSGKSATPKDVVYAWGSEVEFYDESKNNWWPKAGHFSQVIWSTTSKVGGGVIRKNGQEIWVCNYSPRGNWTGERPYSV